MYPELRPDAISVPVHDSVWNDREVHTNGSVANVTCDQELATAVCAGAPCFADSSALGPLNLTCLCPLYPAGTTTGMILLSDVDLGHFGGCEAYAWPGGQCAWQATDVALVGDGNKLREFSVAAVRSMTTASRVRARRDCSAWFAYY